MKPALLVMDIQKDFYKISDEVRESLERAVEYINAAIGLFREKELPIICIQHENKKGGLVPGAEGFKIPDSLKVQSSDTRIYKNYGNAFHQTSLAEMLQEMEIDTLIFTGFCAEYCVLSTCRAALDYDFTAIILRNSLASGSAENIAFVERINEIISLQAMAKLLENF